MNDQKHAKGAQSISDAHILNKSSKDFTDQGKLVKRNLQKFWNYNDGQKTVESYDGVVKELLSVDWKCLKDSLLQEYKTFLLQLTTTNTFYLKHVLSLLVGKFCFKDAKDDLSVKNTEPDHEAIFNEIHNLIENIILLVPLSPVILVNLLTHSFPYMSRDSYMQLCYVKNLLRIIDYLPSERRTILEIIINHLTKLDVHSPKHELLDAGLEDTDFNMELDCMEVEATKTETSLSHATGNTLDLLMNLMFQYIQNVCFTTDAKDKPDWEATKSLYRDLILIFEKLILPTHACCHVQFLVFYICSFKLSLSEMFLDWLWKKVQDPNTATIIRQASVAYIGSLLARSKYVPLKNVTDCLNTMSIWVHHYIDSDGGGSRTLVDVTVHGPFYSVCQAIFYVFAFRHKELHDMKKGDIFLRNLNLQRMVTCRLNPLKVCLPSVVQNFASVARNYQLAYCYTIIERNQRASLPVISYSSTKKLQMTNVNPLDSFFPFDPYALPRSSYFILPLFSEYRSDTEEKEVVSENEEDDFLDAELITPDVVSALPEFLVYSTSPGFKISPT